jgi:hypothetical protein
MNYDPELPAGFQDADFEMRDLDAAGDRARRLMKRGICAHGWLTWLTCNHCGKVFPSIEAWRAEVDDLTA